MRNKKRMDIPSAREWTPLAERPLNSQLTDGILHLLSTITGNLSQTTYRPGNIHSERQINTPGRKPTPINY